MGAEQKITPEQDTDLYSGLDFVVYSASDFKPRGSLYDQSKIKPPYLISDPPLDINSVQDIVAIVEKKDPSSYLKSMLKYLNHRALEMEQTAGLQDRVYPEELSNVLCLNLLREKFQVRVGREQDVFSSADMVAIVKAPGRHSKLAVINLSTGAFFDIAAGDYERKDLAKYTNEELPNVPDPEEAAVKKSQTPKTEAPFEETDVIGIPLRVAKDEGKGKGYPKETINFFSRMNQADLAVENLLINEMDSVVAVSEAVHRLGKRLGRQKTRAILKELRTDGLDISRELVKELSADTKYAHRLDSEEKTLSIDEVHKGLRLMFRAEQLYLSAVLDFPWNNVGPEPFDTLLEVFWFRFDFHTLQDDWTGREMAMGLPKLKSKLYRDAQADRILTWAHETHDNLIASYVSELKDLGIKYTMKEVEEVAGPLSKYFNKEKIKAREINTANESRPSGLTLLLWKTLKWASASEWKNSKTFNFEDMRYVDPELWDEKVADPAWTDIGDLQGRLVLPGETLALPLSHINRDEKDRYRQIEKEVAYSMESIGNVLNLKDLTLEKQRTAGRLKFPKAFESVARDFDRVISHLDWKQLLRETNKLTHTEKLVVLHRLGYSMSGSYTKLDSGPFKYEIKNNQPAKLLINLIFHGNSSGYYRALHGVVEKFNKKIGVV